MGPGGGFCPREEVFLWMRQGKCCRLSTQEVLFVEVWCQEVVFVHRRGHFCGCGEGIAAACPRRGCLVWTKGAWRRLLSTEWVICRNIMKHTGCSMVQAFLMASRNPAKAIGMDHEIGTIAPGKKANLVFTDDAFRIRRVMLNGTFRL